MRKVRTAAVVAVLLGILLLTVGAGAFTTVESQRSAEVYSDDTDTFVGFDVTQTDETACSLTFEITNNIPAPGQTFSIDTVTASGDGFDALVSSYSDSPVNVGESAEVTVEIEDGYVGPADIDIEAEMSGHDLEIEMTEEATVVCEEPDDDDGGNGEPPFVPPGLR